jgi:trk system potassium uptake protein
LLGRIFTEQFAFSSGDSVLVIGMGRFGSSVAQSLIRLGHDVMGIDKDSERVQLWADKLTHAVQADSTKESTMLQLGAADFAHAIVAIGGDIAASLLTLMVLTELGIKDIWVKALDQDHGQLAKRMGAHHVITPEADMGERVAHLITGRLIDFIEFDDGFAIAKIHAPPQTFNKTLRESAVREQYGVTVVGVKRAHTDFQHATPETEVQAADLLIVSGPTRKIELFASGSTKRK